MFGENNLKKVINYMLIEYLNKYDISDDIFEINSIVDFYNIFQIKIEEMYNTISMDPNNIYIKNKYSYASLFFTIFKEEILNLQANKIVFK